MIASPDTRIESKPFNLRKNIVAGNRKINIPAIASTLKTSPDVSGKAFIG